MLVWVQSSFSYSEKSRTWGGETCCDTVFVVHREAVFKLNMLPARAVCSENYVLFSAVFMFGSLLKYR